MSSNFGQAIAAVRNTEQWLDHLNGLTTNGQHLEAFLVSVSLIEAHLKAAVRCYDVLVHYSVPQIDYRPDLARRTKNLDNLTLGEVLEIFHTYCGDEGIYTRLQGLNTLRRNCVHRLTEEQPTDLAANLKKAHLEHMRLLLELIHIIKPLTAEAMRLLEDRLGKELLRAGVSEAG